MSHQYKHITLGGTFDHLHKGHQKLINRAFEAAEKVSLALTSDEFASSKKLSQVILPYRERKKELENYLKEKGCTGRAGIIEISDPYAFALTDTTLDGILVTPDSRENAEKINEKRQKSNLPELSIILESLLPNENNEVISSTKIREGTMDREGFHYLDLFEEGETLLLPQALREELRKPIGTVILGTEDTLERTGRDVAIYIETLTPTLVITVGDIVTKTVPLTPNIAIVDNRSRRHMLDYDETSNEGQVFVNKPGSIDQKLAHELHAQIRRQLEKKSNIRIRVEGEEDLLALPAILFAPLGSVVMYGQYDKGVVVTKVTEETKTRVKALIEQFENSTN